MSFSSGYDSRSITTGAGLFTFHKTATFLCHFHIPVSTADNPQGRSYMCIYLYNTSSILVKDILYGTFVSHNISIIRNITDGMSIGAYTFEPMEVGGGGVGPAHVWFLEL